INDSLPDNLHKVTRTLLTGQTEQMNALMAQYIQSLSKVDDDLSHAPKSSMDTAADPELAAGINTFPIDSNVKTQFFSLAFISICILALIALYLLVLYFPFLCELRTLRRRLRSIYRNNRDTITHSSKRRRRTAIIKR